MSIAHTCETCSMPHLYESHDWMCALRALVDALPKCESWGECTAPATHRQEGSPDMETGERSYYLRCAAHTEKACASGCCGAEPLSDGLVAAVEKALEVLAHE